MIALKILGPNCTEVKVGAVTLGFSYETVVAFHHPVNGWKASENIWSPTTGKHINMIVGRSYPRTPHKEFVDMLNEVIRALEAGKVRA